VISRSPDIGNAEGAPPAPGQPVRLARRSRVTWLRALPSLARPIARTMPWAVLIGCCLVGLGYLAVLTHLPGASRPPLGPGSVRLAFLPAVAAMAFVPQVPFRPLTQTAPVPSWVAPAGHLLLAVPIMAAACWAQLRIAALAVPAHTLGHPAAVYPLMAQLTGWSAAAVAAAACVERSRYADLGGAVAAPVSLSAIALAWYAPASARFLTEPSATAHAVTIAWYAIATAALALTCAAMRDRWHRYTRTRRRLSSPGRNPRKGHIRSAVDSRTS
jgi:hypothetical protein